MHAHAPSRRHAHRGTSKPAFFREGLSASRAQVRLGGYAQAAAALAPGNQPGYEAQIGDLLPNAQLGDRTLAGASRAAWVQPVLWGEKEDSSVEASYEKLRRTAEQFATGISKSRAFANTMGAPAAIITELAELNAITLELTTGLQTSRIYLNPEKRPQFRAQVDDFADNCESYLEDLGQPRQFLYLSLMSSNLGKMHGVPAALRQQYFASFKEGLFYNLHARYSLNAEVASLAPSGAAGGGEHRTDTEKVAEAIRDIHAYGEKAQSTIRKLKKATKSARFSSASGKLDELDGALSKCLGPIGKLLELYDKLHGLGDALGRLAAAIKWIAEMDINQNPKEAAIAFDTLFGAVGHTFMEVGKLLEQKDLRENAWKGDIALHQLAMEGLSMLFRAVGAFFLEADKNSFFEGMGAHLRDSAAERVKAEPGLKGLGIARGLE